MFHGSHGSISAKLQAGIYLARRSSSARVVERTQQRSKQAWPGWPRRLGMLGEGWHKQQGMGWCRLGTQAPSRPEVRLGLHMLGMGWP